MAGSAAGQFREKSWGKDQFPEFVTALAEMALNDQKLYVKETLTEYYDQNCQEKQREVQRGSVMWKWKSVLPGSVEREKENLSFRIRESKRSQWVVAVDKGETWLYGEMSFDWDESVEGWFLTGFKFEMDEPGDCAGNDADLLAAP